MRVAEVIAAKQWRNIRTNRTASLYGAVPWTCDADKSEWTLETVGWTWRCTDGTIGLGRRPAISRAEAQDIMDQINSRLERGTCRQTME